MRTLLLICACVALLSGALAADKDYYKILELERMATPKDVKSAYRRLALRWHPDKQSPDDRSAAEEKFREVAEAYEVLSDEARRTQYDRFGSEPRRGGAGGGGGGPFGAGGFGGGGFGGGFHHSAFRDADKIFKDFFGDEDPFAAFGDAGPFGGGNPFGRSRASSGGNANGGGGGGNAPPDPFADMFARMGGRANPFGGGGGSSFSSSSSSSFSSSSGGSFSSSFSSTTTTIGADGKTITKTVTSSTGPDGKQRSRAALEEMIGGKTTRRVEKSSDGPDGRGARPRIRGDL